MTLWIRCMYTILICALLGTALVMAPAARASQSKPSDFDKYLKSKGSPLDGQGKLLDSYGQKYNVDPRLIIAIAGAETTFGKNTNGLNCPQYKNLWNLLQSGKCMRFSNWDEAINQIAAQLRQYREQRGLKTISAIGKTYCTSGCQNWESNVKMFYREQGGDPNSGQLTYAFDLGTNGVDLWQYCLKKWSDVDQSRPVELRGTDANSWFCRAKSGRKIEFRGINVTEACSWQYKNVYQTQSPSGAYKAPGIYARTDNSRDPHSWRCYYQQ